MLRAAGQRAVLIAVLCIGGAAAMSGQSATAPSGFDAAASTGLVAMREKAATMKVEGVALMAYFEGQTISAWTSKMLVVGKMKNAPTETNKGANLLAVAYSKAAEMAETLKDSGSGARPPMNGEFGYKGGVIVPWKAGYLIVAFSGGKGEEDVAISQAGVGQMAGVKKD